MDKQGKFIREGARVTSAVNDLQGTIQQIRGGMVGVLKLGTRQVVWVRASELDKPKHKVGRAGKPLPKGKVKPTAPKAPKAPKAVTPKAPKAESLTYVAARESDYERLTRKGLIEKVSRTDYADK